MNSLRYFALTLLSIGMCACDIDAIEDNSTHYQFSEAEKSLLISYPYKPDQIITYRNEEGETLHFRVLKNSYRKRDYLSRGSFAGGGGQLLNYYDSQIIRLEILENPSFETYSKVHYIASKNDNIFSNGLNFPLWNRTEINYLDALQDNVNILLQDANSFTKTRMAINGHDFQKVIRLQSGSKEALQSPLFGPLSQNIHTILYDFDFGIVQFTDTEGHIWKVEYPNPL